MKLLPVRKRVLFDIGLVEFGMQPLFTIPGAHGEINTRIFYVAKLSWPKLKFYPDCFMT